MAKLMPKRRCQNMAVSRQKVSRLRYQRVSQMPMMTASPRVSGTNNQ